TGLGLFGGACTRFATPGLKVPQIGWNEVRPRKGSKLFAAIEPGSSFYFIHSYHAVPRDPAVVAATTDYGLEYACAFERGRLAAVQFHPEKSGPRGLALLASFLAL